MRTKAICSRENTFFRSLLKLNTARGIKKQGMAVMSGPRQVVEVLGDFPEKCVGLITAHHHKTIPQNLAGDIPVYVLSRDLFREIDLFGTDSPLLMVRVETLGKWPGEKTSKGCLLCVPFQDPANVGAVLRSAAAFGVSAAVILKEAAHPFLPRSLRVAGSAIFRVPLFQGPSLESLMADDLPLVALSPEGIDISNYAFPPAFCLVPGLEGPGLPQNLGGAKILSIPMQHGVESINAALATGIALYLWRDGLKRRDKA
jgi:tRNA G18 (ribose-2'-O)-methylase SpoU